MSSAYEFLIPGTAKSSFSSYKSGVFSDTKCSSKDGDADTVVVSVSPCYKKEIDC